MRKVVCMDSGKEFWLKCDSGELAIKGMKHFLDIGCRDRYATIKKLDDRWELYHGEKVYACLL